MKVHLYLRDNDFGHRGYLRLSEEACAHLRDMCRTHPESVLELHGEYVEGDSERGTSITLIVPVCNIVAVRIDAEGHPRQRLTQRSYSLNPSSRGGTAP